MPGGGPLSKGAARLRWAACRDDNEKFSQSRVAQQRAEALQRAEERSAREQEEAKVAQREALKAQRWFLFTLPSKLLRRSVPDWLQQHQPCRLEQLSTF